VLKLTNFDYEYLTGKWDGPPGAAFNVVAEDCMNAGYGYYGHPTEKGQKAIIEFERDHVHSVKMISPTEVAKAALHHFRKEI
jgi:hypothetical protein